MRRTNLLFAYAALLDFRRRYQRERLICRFAVSTAVLVTILVAWSSGGPFN